MPISLDDFFPNGLPQSPFSAKCSVCGRRMTPIPSNVCNRCAELIAKAKELESRLDVPGYLEALDNKQLGIEAHMANWVLKGLRGQIQPGVNLALGADEAAIAQYVLYVNAEIQRREKALAAGASQNGVSGHAQ